MVPPRHNVCTMRQDRDRDHAAEHLGRLERRAEILRERITAHGSSASTSSEAAELSSVEAAIALLDGSRWRRSIDEPIPDVVNEILAAVVDRERATMLLRRSGADEWECGCGCGLAVGGDRVIRWRPLAAGAPRDEDAVSPIVGPTSYRGRKRLAIIEDRIQYLTARAAELKAQGSPARYERDELEALSWLRELALRANNR